MTDRAGELLQVFRPHATPYDVLGYLIPGGLFLLMATSFDALTMPPNPAGRRAMPLYDLLVNAIASATIERSWAVGAVVLVVAVVVAYAVGHLIASVSAILIDRVYLSKAHGYPMPRMLGIAKPDSYNVSQNFYRAGFVWINLYLVIRFLTVPGALPLQAVLPRPLMDLAPNVDTLSAVRLNAFSSWIAWGLLVLLLVKWTLSTRRWRLVREGSAKWAWRVSFEFALLIVSYPGRLVTGFLGRMLHTREQIDDASIQQFKHGLRKILGFDVDFASSAPYWFSVIHVRASSLQAADACDNWLRLYSFARNLSCACYLGFLYAYIAWLNHGASFVADHGRGALMIIYAYPLLLLVVSWVLLLRFYYLYVAYYTKYLIRTIAYLGRS